MIAVVHAMLTCDTLLFASATIAKSGSMVSLRLQEFQRAVALRPGLFVQLFLSKLAHPLSRSEAFPPGQRIVH